MVDKMIRTAQLANQLLAEYDLVNEGWHFDFSNTKKRVGECNYSKKCIRFSMHYLRKTSDAEIENILRHEIAHALVGWVEGHGPVWKAMAIRVGARPERCTNEAQTTAKYNYVIKCDNPNCSRPYQGKRYRLRWEMVNNYYCKSCGGPLTAYEYKWR